MPNETKQAIGWALAQTISDPFGNQFPITKDDQTNLVDKVREYFNTNNITYTTFSYDDLQSYLV